MKKLLLTLMVVFVFASGLTSQIIEDQTFRYDGKEMNIDALRKEFKARQNASKDPIGWLVPAWDILDNYFGTYDSVNHYANIIFPDSTVVYESGGTFEHTWMHSAASGLDPHALIFDFDLMTPPVPPGAPYMVDSIFVIGWYSKAVNVVDTLRIELVHGTPRVEPDFYGIQYTSNGFKISAPKITSSNTQFGAVTQLSGPSKTVINYPLTDADSTMGSGKYIIVPVGLSVPGGHVVAANLTFVPGYTYSFGDSLFSYSGGMIANPQMNAFRVGFYGTKPEVVNTLYFAQDSIFAYNLSFYNHLNTRYQMWTSPLFLNEILYPASRWGMDIGFHLSANIGVESNSGNIISLGQNYPNPFSSFTTVNYTLSEAADVTFDLFDQTGRKVMSIDRGVELPGTQTLELDATSLRNGIYFYTLTAGNYKASKKMVVLK